MRRARGGLGSDHDSGKVVLGGRMALATDEPGGGATLLSVKAVPGAKRDQVSGLLGERLKVRVSQPPEGGKANRAICELLAEELGVKSSAVSVVRGASSAEKVVRIEGVTAAMIERKWGSGKE